MLRGSLLRWARSVSRTHGFSTQLLRNRLLLGLVRVDGLPRFVLEDVIVADLRFRDNFAELSLTDGFLLEIRSLMTFILKLLCGV